MSRRSASRLLFKSIDSFLNSASKTTAHDSACSVGLARKMGIVALPNTKEGKVLHPDLINEHVKSAQYAVRGELYLRAQELLKEGREIIFTNGTSITPLPFDRVW